MERLLEDAEKLSGIHYDISNYADIIEAIHVIQTEMGITGTTAKEASETIEGSANAAKAAWQNLLTAFGRNDADIDKQVDELTNSVETLVKNVIPVAERAFVSLTKTALREGIELSKQLPDLADKAMEHIHQTIAKEFGGAADNIFAVETAVKAAAGAFIAYKSAMVVSDAVEGVIALTKVIKGATTAQEALNAAGLANPFVLVATAIAGATIALKSYRDTQTDLIDEAELTYGKLSDAQQSFIDSSNKLAKGISNDIENARGSIDSVNAEVGALSKMTDELYRINEAETLSNEQKARMKTLVDSLNESLPGLNLQLDTETGHLKNQREEVDKLIESYQLQAKAQAAQESLVQLYKDQYEAEKKLTEAEKARTEGQKNLEAAQKRVTELAKEYKNYRSAFNLGRLAEDEIAQMNALEGQLEAAKNEVEQYENAMGDLNGAFVTANENQREVNGAINDMSVIAAEAAGATDLLADGTEESTERISASTSEQARMARMLSNELKDYIMTVGGETYNISQDTYDKLQELSDKYQEALTSQEENIRNSLDLFSEFNGGAETSANELLTNLDANAQGLEKWAENIQTLADWGINEGLLQQLEEAGPSSANLVQAMINMGEPKLKEYSEKWAETQKRIHEIAVEQTEDVKKQTEYAMAELIGVATDNKDKAKAAYQDLGNYITQGAGGAIADGTSDYVVPVTGEMVMQMEQEAAKKIQEANFPDKGENIDKGVAEGIRNGTHWTVEEMNNMIDEIENAYMQRTQSHSPSKLFEKLAGYIPQGMALGIDEKKSDVVDSMKGIVNAAIQEASKLDVESKTHFSKSNSGSGLVMVDPRSSYESNTEEGAKFDKGAHFTTNDGGSQIGYETQEEPQKTNRRSYQSGYSYYGGDINIKIMMPDYSVIAQGTAPFLDIINGKVVYLQNMGLST